MEQAATQHPDDDHQDAPPPLTRTTLRGVGIAGIGYSCSIGLTFATYLVLARLITPTDFGRYAAGTVITGIGGLFAESGMMAALVSRRDRIEEAASTAFYSLLVTGFLLMLASLALSPLLGLFYGGSHIGLIAAAMSGWLWLRALTIVPDALLQRRFSFLRRVIVDPLGVLAWAAASIALAAGGAGVWALVAGSYASMVVQVVSAWWFARFVPRLRLASVAMWRELASFARSVILAEVLRRIAQQIDALVLGKFQGPAPLGQYRNGLRLVSQPAFAFVSVTAYVLYPAFARIAASPQRISAAVRRVYWVTMTAAVPISFAAIPLGVPLAVVFLGSRWRPAGHAMAGLCGFVLGTTIVSIASEFFKSIGRPRALVGVQAVGFCLIAVTVTVSAIVWGLLGVAVSMSASTCATAAFGLRRVCALADISPRALPSWFAGPAVATGLMIVAMLLFAGAVHPLSHRAGGRLALVLAEIGLGGVVYLLVLGVIDAPRRREALRLRRGLLTRRSRLSWGRTPE